MDSRQAELAKAAPDVSQRSQTVADLDGMPLSGEQADSAGRTANVSHAVAASDYSVAADGGERLGLPMFEEPAPTHTDPSMETRPDPLAKPILEAEVLGPLDQLRGEPRDFSICAPSDLQKFASAAAAEFDGRQTSREVSESIRPMEKVSRSEAPQPIFNADADEGSISSVALSNPTYTLPASSEADSEKCEVGVHPEDDKTASYEEPDEFELIDNLSSIPCETIREPANPIVDKDDYSTVESKLEIEEYKPFISKEEDESWQTPSKYRPQLRERAGKLSPRPSKVPAVPTSTSAPIGSLDADLLLAFQPGGWGIVLRVLFRRAGAMPAEMAIRLSGETLILSAIDDGLFEPAMLKDPSLALSRGISAQSAAGPARRWIRTGRRLHVFTERPGIIGFASVPRALIGQENVILVEANLAGHVLDCCGATGASNPEEVFGPGVPDGWRCFRGFRPQRPGELDNADDIFLALSPLPHAAIELTGGIAVSRAAWINTRPPLIRILGSEPTHGDVTIDGEPALHGGEDRWTATGWDKPGHHTVRYAGLSRTYEIIVPEEYWPAWPAHAGPGYSIAGAFVFDATGRPAIVLSGSACWLIGPKPGEIAWAAALPGGFSAGASPDFVPTWAISPKSGRRRQSPRLIGPLEAPQTKQGKVSAQAIRTWCQVVRDASRVPVARGSEREASAIWARYLEAARTLRKGVR